ncbi:MAG: aminodeoxychorismate/anthranilate synthase component II [Bacteroidota bacterium]
MKLFVVDNYDSFTYNLIQMVEQNGISDYIIRDNEHLDFDEISDSDKILISPGAGLPCESGKLMAMISTFYSKKSILGICLGHQAIAEAFGATLKVFDKPFHGYTTRVKVSFPKDPIFNGVSDVFEAGLYHSWHVDKQSLPPCFRLTALSEEGIVMGLAHKENKLRGLQFHPESIMTPQGKQIIGNWLKE